jgi:fructokinase
MEDKELLTKNIVGLREILWDIFPEAAHFGGAPVNFACHAAALGATASVVSAVGEDTLGQKAIDALRLRNVSLEYIQCDPSHRTGTVDVTIDDRGQASYRFAANAAWDHLAWSDRLATLASSCDAVCFGSLAQRSSISRQTIHQFVEATRTDCLRIFDVNLRHDFYSRDVIEKSLNLASVMKLNDDELPIVVQLLNGPSVSDEEKMRWLRETYKLSIVALTRGAAGSIIYAEDRFDSQLPPKVDVIDTVGAGDAFTAALAIGLLKKQHIAEIHRSASLLAASVCCQRGAMPDINTTGPLKQSYER